MRRILLALVIIAALGGCKSFIEGYSEGFTESWKESFIDSCVEGDDTDYQRQVCTCVAERAVKELSVKQLHDINFTIKYIEENIIDDCR